MLERRTLSVEVEAREADDGPVLTWYPAVFDKWSEDMGFREIIRPGAFTKTLQEADIRGLFNHDPNYVLGRNRSDTLRLVEDVRGLLAEARPPDTQWARDLMVTVGRGDVNQGSFGFSVPRGRDRWAEGDEGLEREILEARLFDVSVVTFPAYPDAAGVQLRSLLESVGVEYGKLAGPLLKAGRGVDLTDRDREAIEAAIDILRGYLPAGAGQEATPVDSEASDEQKQEWMLAAKLREMELQLRQ